MTVDYSSELVDAAMSAATLVPANGGHLISFDVTAQQIRVNVHPTPLNQPDERVDPDARCGLVRHVARLLDDVTAAPDFRNYGTYGVTAAGAYTALGVYHGRSVVVSAELDEVEAEYLAARIRDGEGL